MSKKNANSKAGHARQVKLDEVMKKCTSLEECKSDFEPIEKEGGSYSVIYVSITNLADIRKSRGDDVVERVVDVVSTRLKRCVRGGDSAYQVEEGEYVVVIRGAYGVGAYQSLQDRIRNAVGNEITLDDTEVYIAIGFGYARYPEDGDGYKVVIEHARAVMIRTGRSNQRAQRLVNDIVSDIKDAAPAEEGAPLSDDLLLARSHIDELTGLADAQHFRSRAAKIVEDPERRAQGLAMVFCDIEEFKTYNLRYGYAAGDDLLKFVADTLEDLFPGELIARLNSDRFGILTSAKGVVEKIQQAHDIVHGFRMSTNVELKAGICDVLEGYTATNAQDYARMACDSTKGHYDQCWRHFDDKLATEMQRRQHIVDNLNTAINSGWIEAHYQPVIRTLNGKLAGMEALARWNDPKFGMLPPGEFIGVLEDAHLIHKLDIAMIKQVCTDGRRLLDEGRPPIGVSVNLSRLDYQLCDIFGIVEEIVEDSGYPRKYLHIEVTESAFTEDADYLKNVLDKFREAGYEIWMDDFGSGYSSLNLLKDYNFDVLKIDMLFLRGLEDSPRTRDIIASVVDMAKKIGIQTLAEGVETEQQFNFLKSIGCEKTQGYLLCRPEPLERILEKVDSGELDIEEESLREYYDVLGRVNMLSPAPFEQADERAKSMEFSSGVPLALFERCDGKMTTIVSSGAFDDVVNESGLLASASGADEKVFTDKGAKIINELMRLGEVIEGSGNERFVSFYDFKDLYTLRMKHVAQCGARHAYLISLNKHDTSVDRQQEPYMPAGGAMVYLPQTQQTKWQQTDEINWKSTAVVVVDVLGGSEGVTPGLENMAANCVSIVKAARAKGIPVIFSNDAHIPGLDRELELWGDHGLRDTPGGTVLTEFEVDDSDFIIPKRRYDGFFETDLELTLRELDVDTLIMMGADTNITVLQTLAGAYYHGYKTIVPSDATATYLIGNQEDALEYFTRVYDSRVVDTATIVKRITEEA